MALRAGLIDDTEASLVRYADPAILPLIGVPVDPRRQGSPNEYQHWIHLSRIVDPRRLDPDVPESLVFRNDPDDGPVLEAAMYMLPPGYNLDVSRRHRLAAGLARPREPVLRERLRAGGRDGQRQVRAGCGDHRPADGACGSSTRCGRFAGVDEHGLQCHHEH